MDSKQREELPLPEAMTHLLEECRMVLPGIQALFGFQLIAVFNSSFAEKLSWAEQRLHLLAIGLVAIAVALVMAPAAYHRLSHPMEATKHFIRIASRLLLASMFPLMVSICLDFYIISRLISNNRHFSLLLSFFLLCVFATLWFLFPRLHYSIPRRIFKTN